MNRTCFVRVFLYRTNNLLTYYLNSRSVADFETLVELLISDRLKGALPQGPLNYVLTQEGEGWFAYIYIFYRR